MCESRVMSVVRVTHQSQNIHYPSLKSLERSNIYSGCAKVKVKGMVVDNW